MSHDPYNKHSIDKLDTNLTTVIHTTFLHNVIELLVIRI